MTVAVNAVNERSRVVVRPAGDGSSDEELGLRDHKLTDGL